MLHGCDSVHENISGAFASIPFANLVQHLGNVIAVKVVSATLALGFQHELFGRRPSLKRSGRERGRDGGRINCEISKSECGLK